MPRERASSRIAWDQWTRASPPGRSESGCPALPLSSRAQPMLALGPFSVSRLLDSRPAVFFHAGDKAVSNDPGLDPLTSCFRLLPQGPSRASLLRVLELFRRASGLLPSQRSRLRRCAGGAEGEAGSQPDAGSHRRRPAITASPGIRSRGRPGIRGSGGRRRQPRGRSAYRGAFRSQLRLRRKASRRFH